MKKFLIISLITTLCLMIAGVSALKVDQDQVRQILTSSEKSFISKPATRKFSIQDITSLSFATPIADLKFVQDEALNNEIIITYQEHYKKDKQEVFVFPNIEEKRTDNKLSIEFNRQDKKNKTNNSFKLESSNKFPFFTIATDFQDSKILIKIPKNSTLKSLDLGLASGQIDIPNLELENLTIDLVTGDINLVDLNAKTVVIEVVTGDVQINNSKYENLKIDTVTGDVNLQNVSLSSDYSIETVTGDISIESIDSLVGDLNISSATGDIEVDGTNYKREYSVKGKSSSVKLNLEVVTGDIRLLTKTN